MESEKEILIEAKNVSKKFTMSLKKGMVYGLRDVTGAMLGMKGNRAALRKDEFWAVKDINFTLRRGECLGLIGRNGAGKSTLLKMLNGLIRPDEGSITMRGKIGALIELGAGFNPILTGRENIFVNGQILGFSKTEIESKMDAIIDFAEIGEFIDSPVRNYSSGMRVRLGFAVAAQMEPDILLIDEVLAVGDVGFRIKCYNKIQELLKRCAIIFVSHTMPDIVRIANKLILMDQGEKLFYGVNLHDGINQYYEIFSHNKGEKTVFNNGIEINKCEFNNNNNKFAYKESLCIKLYFHLIKRFENIRIAISFSDSNLKYVAFCQSDYIRIDGNKDDFVIKMEVPLAPFTTGVYSYSVEVYNILNIENSLTENLEVLARYQDMGEFKFVNPNSMRQIPILLNSNFTVCY